MLRDTCKVSVCKNTPCPEGNGYCYEHTRTPEGVDHLISTGSQTIKLQKRKSTVEQRHYWSAAQRKHRQKKCNKIH